MSFPLYMSPDVSSSVTVWPYEDLATGIIQTMTLRDLRTVASLRSLMGMPIVLVILAAPWRGISRVRYVYNGVVAKRFGSLAKVCGEQKRTSDVSPTSSISRARLHPIHQSTFRKLAHAMIDVSSNLTLFPFTAQRSWPSISLAR